MFSLEQSLPKRRIVVLQKYSFSKHAKHSAYGGVKAVDVGGQPMVRHNLRDGGPLTASEIKSSTLQTNTERAVFEKLHS
jgi:hypothetical protein